MKALLLMPAFCLACGVALTATAQQPAKPAADMRRDYSPNSVTRTPEMWFYEQERSRYEDPKSAVRRRAEFKAAQRSNRMASMRWYGMSNSRPTASVTPWYGTYSPTWTSNSADPFRWTATGQTSILFSPGKLY